MSSKIYQHLSMVCFALSIVGLFNYFSWQLLILCYLALTATVLSSSLIAKSWLIYKSQHSLFRYLGFSLFWFLSIGASWRWVKARIKDSEEIPAERKIEFIAYYSHLEEDISLLNQKSIKK
ncbi:hypothetical protein L0B53_13555 [Vibrio sp. SS-MA-C1-2]|uniref:hypothetical protein n=1 Tax=Vibrio sp. SS-MA-C1-2 TaxID=2908646 RepID=UPI001F21D18B|nr:hypothetical protein [Vibrio sp. SS-MA-C1-2]UJF18044.1 hypothetical protein L0B53_13555 [Vibrio sp. SS-MA-C1-2]